MNIQNALPLTRTLAVEAPVAGVETMPKPPKPSLIYSNTDAARANEAASLARKALSLPDVRAEKVEAVKAAIADGSYHVDAADLAQALIERMLDEKESL